MFKTGLKKVYTMCLCQLGEDQASVQTWINDKEDLWMVEWMDG